MARSTVRFVVAMVVSQSCVGIAEPDFASAQTADRGTPHQAATPTKPTRVLVADPQGDRSRNAFARQIAVQEQIRWLNGLSPLWREQGRFPSLETVYSGLSAGRETPGRSDLFEPLPLVPGDINAAPYLGTVRQPIGHRITPLPGGGYSYEPIYHAHPRRDPVPEVTTPTVEELPPPARVPVGLREF